eukprot:TRINITY_DN13283_c0_g1_i1.p1 TRINITY_DN13283_c0_g1~~TRINITY_DN13283_c0_g1_i1.p1  ORF type:complete len:367 (+),score=56.93 TRINITY_DN13283_c0_g1_i1:58-1158(+)
MAYSHHGPYATPCGCYFATTPEHSCTQMCSESGCTASCRYGYPAHPPQGMPYPPPHPVYSYPAMYYGGGWMVPPPGQYPQPHPVAVPPQQVASYGESHNHLAQRQVEQQPYAGGSYNSTASSEGTSEEHPEQERTEKTLREKLQGLLNRISSAKYDENYDKIRALVHDEHEVRELTEAIYQQSVVQPKFVGVYANLCLDLCKTLSPKDCTTDKERFISCPFRRSLLEKCQHRFENVLAAGEEEKNDEKSILTFISSLHSKGIIGTKTIVGCLSALLDKAQKDIHINNTKSPIQLELLIHFFKAVHASVLSKTVATEDLERIFQTIQELQDQVSTRFKFLIMDLVETKDNFQKKQREFALRASAQES